MNRFESVRNARELATTLEASLGTVMPPLSRARRRLREEITQIQDPEIEDEQ